LSHASPAHKYPFFLFPSRLRVSLTTSANFEAHGFCRQDGETPAQIYSMKENASNERNTAGNNFEELSALVVDCSYKLHTGIGPGLLESVYEVILAKMLEDHGLQVERQVPVPIQVMNLNFDEGFRADLIVNRLLLVELKSTETLAPVHYKQVLTYLRLLKMPLGLLINFGTATFKEGIKRVVNNHHNLAGSRLRINETR